MRDDTRESVSVPPATLNMLLNFICANTEIPIGLVERAGKPRVIIPSKTRQISPRYCKAVWATKHGREQCDQDHVTRANKVEEQTVIICHAGLMTLAVPITIDGATKAVLFCGQCQPTDPVLRKEAQRWSEEFWEDMNANGRLEWTPDAQRKTQALYDEVESRSTEDLKMLTDKVYRIPEWMIWAHAELSKINSDKKEIAKRRDEARQTATFLVHDMAEPLQCIIDAASIVGYHASPESGKNKHLRSDINFLKRVFLEARSSLSRVHYEFTKAVPTEKEETKMPDPIDETVVYNLLDVFCQSSDLAIGIFERTGAKRALITDLAKEKFTPYCRAVWTAPLRFEVPPV
ncbi:MAG: PocR ligand-binding domain-containing protein [bacterium]